MNKKIFEIVLVVFLLSPLYFQYIVAASSCCDGIEYDPQSEECCDGNIVPIGECCNGQPLGDGQECCRETNPEVAYNVGEECCSKGGVSLKTAEYDNWSEFIKKCPNRVEREGFSATSNGCSTPDSLDSSITQQYNEKFEDCCNAHDIDYSKCNLKKSTADRNFRRCMRKECGFNVLCRQISNLYLAAVQVGGRSFWRNAQMAACQCCE